MNSKCKQMTRKNRNNCLTAKKTYSKRLDCQCPVCLSGKKYVNCVKNSGLKRRRSKNNK